MSREAIEAIQWALKTLRDDADVTTLAGQMTERLVSKMEKLNDKLEGIRKQCEGG